MAESKTRRKIAVILATDVVGFSKKMEENDKCAQILPPPNELLIFFLKFNKTLCCSEPISSHQCLYQLGVASMRFPRVV